MHIVGSLEPGGESKYVAEVRRLMSQHDWIDVHEDLDRATLLDLIARHRYGLHGMREEHFGLAVAELALAGAIVFVHRSGGQVEIVGDRRLTYGTEPEAVELIERVMSDDDLQAILRDSLARRTEQFRAEHFIDQITSIIAEIERR